MKCRYCSFRAFQIQSGFTLIEVVIAISLLVIVITLVFSGMRFATKVWDKGINYAASANEIYLVQNWIRDRISRAQPINIISRENKTKIEFSGDSEGIRFISSLPSHSGGGGLYILQIVVKELNKVNQLILHYDLYHANSDRLGSEKTKNIEVLLDDVSDVKFSYFGLKKGEKSGSWNNQWKDRRYLPHQVRIDLKFRNSSVDWPLFIANLHNDGYRPWL